MSAATPVLPLPDAHATQALGAALARSCPWDARVARWVALEGELGAGKTTLAQGLLQALGVTAAVRSPTYTLVETYPVACGLVVHVDLYRLHGAQEVEELGLRDYQQGHVLMLVEWPQRAGAALPAADLTVWLEVDGEARRAALQAGSPAGQQWLVALSGS